MKKPMSNHAAFAVLAMLRWEPEVCDSMLLRCLWNRPMGSPPPTPRTTDAHLASVLHQLTLRQGMKWQRRLAKLCVLYGTAQAPLDQVCAWINEHSVMDPELRRVMRMSISAARSPPTPTESDWVWWYAGIDNLKAISDSLLQKLEKADDSQTLPISYFVCDNGTLSADVDRDPANINAWMKLYRLSMSTRPATRETIDLIRALHTYANRCLSTRWTTTAPTNRERMAICWYRELLEGRNPTITEQIDQLLVRE